MNIQDQVSYYNTLWAERMQLNSLQLRRAVKVLEYFADVKRAFNSPRVLDLGCGDGRFTGFLGEFADTDGIELSEEAVKYAQKQHPHVHFFQGNALDYDFGEAIYDVVISQEVIEHIEDQEKYLENCFRVLKKGGYLIITTPNKKVFDHMEGGNWSKQPIEKILNPKDFKTLISKFFTVKKYDSIIMNFGNLGYFKIINHRLVLGGCKVLGLKSLRAFILSKLGFGLHQCILAQKE